MHLVLSLIYILVYIIFDICSLWTLLECRHHYLSSMKLQCLTPRFDYFFGPIELLQKVYLEDTWQATTSPQKPQCIHWSRYGHLSNCTTPGGWDNLMTENLSANTNELLKKKITIVLNLVPHRKLMVGEPNI